VAGVAGFLAKRSRDGHRVLLTPARAREPARKLAPIGVQAAALPGSIKYPSKRQECSSHQGSPIGRQGEYLPDFPGFSWKAFSRVFYIRMYLQ